MLGIVDRLYKLCNLHLLRLDERPTPVQEGGTIIDGFVFRNVAFHYPSSPDSYIFSNISMTLHPGSINALVGPTTDCLNPRFLHLTQWAGPSGSGKTSLLHLIAGLYRPDEGQVIVNGRDLSQLPVEEVR